MKFLIQSNLINDDHLSQIKESASKYPHVFVNLIPFSREITANEPIIGDEYIPYGSTLLTNLGYQVYKWKGIHFNLETFNYSAALKNRNDMLNDNVMSLQDAIPFLEGFRPGDCVFVRPSEDLKQFSGQTIDALECADWFRDMMECETSGSYKLEPSTQVVVSTPKNIQAEWRWFIVGGRVVSGSMYRAHGQLRKERSIETDIIQEAQKIADIWLPDDCCVMDLALVGGELKVIEFNTINSSGFYDNDIPAVFDALWEYHTK